MFGGQGAYIEHKQRGRWVKVHTKGDVFVMQAHAMVMNANNRASSAVMDVDL